MENSKTILTFVKSLNSDKKCRNERRKTPLEDGHRPQEQRWVKQNGEQHRSQGFHHRSESLPDGSARYPQVETA
jgi:hypothetical protein